MNAKSNLNMRIQGAMVGLAIGDALGAPFENSHPETIAAGFPYGVHDYVVGSGCPYRPGQGTDDTELALLVSQSLVEKRALDMHDISGRLVAWGKTQTFLGPSTGAGLQALEMGVHFREAGSTRSASSGCLPRCAPVALVIPFSSLVDATVDCCLPTHRHPLAIAATVAQNLILSSLIQGKEWLQSLEEVENPMLKGYMVHLTPIIAAFQGDFHEPGAVDILAEATYCMAKAANAEEALSLAVEMGGDTDTRAAVVGTFAGANWGRGGLPQRWIDNCELGNEMLELGSALALLRQELLMSTSFD